MKISIDIDCTPQEARAFFGLPDVTRFQETVLQELQKTVAESAANMDAEALMKLWTSGAKDGLAELQKNLWSAFASGGKKTD